MANSVFYTPSLFYLNENQKLWWWKWPDEAFIHSSVMCQNSTALNWKTHSSQSSWKKTKQKTHKSTFIHFLTCLSHHIVSQSEPMYIGAGRRSCVYATFKSIFITFHGKYVEVGCGVVVFWALSFCLVSVISSSCIAWAGKHDCTVIPCAVVLSLF